MDDGKLFVKNKAIIITVIPVCRNKILKFENKNYFTNSYI